MENNIESMTFRDLKYLFAVSVNRIGICRSVVVAVRVKKRTERFAAASLQKVLLQQRSATQTTTNRMNNTTLNG